MSPPIGIPTLSNPATCARSPSIPNESIPCNSNESNVVHSHAAAAAHRAFGVILHPAKLQNPKATRRRKGKSEGYYLAQQRAKEDQRLKQIPSKYRRPELRSHVSAPILDSRGQTQSPVRQLVDCMKPQEDFDDHAPAPVGSTCMPDKHDSRLKLGLKRTKAQALSHVPSSSAIPEEHRRHTQQRISYDDPLAGFSAFFRGSETAEATRELSRLVHPRQAISTLQEIRINHNEPSFVSGFINTPVCSPQQGFSQHALRQTQSSTALSLGNKARSISKSIRKRLGRSSSRYLPETSRLPVQHVSAINKHFGSSSSHSHEPSEVFDERCWPDFDETMLEDEVPPSPPIHGEIRCEGSAILPPSVGLHDQPIRSRVSSWTESEDCHTAETPSIMLEPIKESVESSNPHLGVVNQIMHQDDKAKPSTRSFEIPSRIGSLRKKAFQVVDSQRVYSAVMKRMSARSRHKSDRASHEEDSSEIVRDRACDMDPDASVAPTGKVTVRIIGPDQIERIPESNYPGHGRYAQPDPRDLMSPSIYSERVGSFSSTMPDKASIADRHRQSEDSGVAIIHESRSFARWRLAEDEDPFDAVDMERPEQVLKTSAEWRNWASSQIEGLDHIPPEFVRRDIGATTDAQKGHHREEAQIDESETRIRPSRTFRRVLSALTVRPSFSSTRVVPTKEEALMLDNPWRQIGERASSSRSRLSSDTRSSGGKTEIVRSAKEPIIGLDGPRPKSHKLQTQSAMPLTMRKDSRKDSKRENRRPFDSAVGDAESKTVLINARSMADMTTASVPANTYMDENFLQRIRRGPYDSKSPSPTSRLPRASQIKRDPFSRRPGAANFNENKPLHDRENMVHEFLRSREGRAGANVRSPSGVDLLDSRKKSRSPYANSPPAFL